MQKKVFVKENHIIKEFVNKGLFAILHISFVSITYPFDVVETMNNVQEEELINTIIKEGQIFTRTSNMRGESREEFVVRTTGIGIYASQIEKHYTCCLYSRAPRPPLPSGYFYIVKNEYLSRHKKNREKEGVWPSDIADFAHKITNPGH